MFNYSSPRKNVFYSQGIKYCVRPYYNRVLAFLKACDDKDLSIRNLCAIAGRLFLRPLGRFRLKHLSMEDCEKWLTDFIMHVIQTGKNADENCGKENETEQIFDFWVDAEYVYAAFYQAYRIDLHKAVNHMFWGDFIALLSGLPKDTRLSDIMDIRGRPIPERTDYNSEEIRRLEEAKDFFALHKHKKVSYKQGLGKLFSELKAWAES